MNIYSWWNNLPLWKCKLWFSCNKSYWCESEITAFPHHRGFGRLLGRAGHRWNIAWTDDGLVSYSSAIKNMISIILVYRLSLKPAGEWALCTWLCSDLINTAPHPHMAAAWNVQHKTSSSSSSPSRMLLREISHPGHGYREKIWSNSNLWSVRLRKTWKEET